MCQNLSPGLLRLEFFGFCYIEDDQIKMLVKQCPKLQALDVGETEISTIGVQAIINNLHFLEDLAIPEEIGIELKVESDLVIIQKLKKLKLLLMKDDDLDYFQYLVEEEDDFSLNMKEIDEDEDCPQFSMAHM